MSVFHQQPVPTIEQRRALAACLAAEREAETSRGWNDYMREQNYRAERYEPTHKMEMDLPVPSVWQIIKYDFRIAPLHQRIGFALFAGFSVGVTVALIGGWL